MQPRILKYTKTTTNYFGANVSRTYYSVYNSQGTLVIHTSDKRLAVNTLNSLNTQT